MTEDDLLHAVRNLADQAEVQAFLGKSGATPELRRRVEEEWMKRRSVKASDDVPADPSKADTNSVHLRNTVVFETGAAPDDRTKRYG